MCFLEEIIEIIHKGRLVPKYQVERAFTPVLQVFIEDIMFHSTKTRWKLISPEFPLLKEKEKEQASTFQSTNIDFFFINKERTELAFLELKTDKNSLNVKQMDIYRRVKKEVRGAGAAMLFDNLKAIRERSRQKRKYNLLIKSFSEALGQNSQPQEEDKIRKKLKNITELKVYLLCPGGVNSHGSVDDSFSFKSLKEVIPEKNRREWRIIAERISEFDDIPGCMS